MVKKKVSQPIRAKKRSPGGSVRKVISFGGGGSVTKIESTQLSEDPFTGMTGYGEAIREPPYSLEQLVLLAETHPVHAAALEQKASDIIATGLQFVPKDGIDNANERQAKDLGKWWEQLFEDFTPLEVLNAEQLDYETTGWGAIEIARDSQGNLGALYNIPAHTLRAHSDGERYVQIRQGKRVWYKRWGVEGDFYSATGHKVGAAQSPNASRVANEVLMFRKPSRRSTWYGIPGYISATGWILLATAARDYNILFFENAREPRHLVVLEGLEEEVDDMLTDLETQLKTQHQDPHRNLLVPLTGGAKLSVHRMSLPVNEIQFDKLLSRTDDEILISHRMPSDRIGLVKRAGSIGGGSVSATLNRIYKDSIVTKGQAVNENRWGRFIEIEASKAGVVEGELQYRADFAELDIADEAMDTKITIEQVTANLISLNEGRQRLGIAGRDDFGEMTLDEYLVFIGADGGGAARAASPAEANNAAFQDRTGRLLDDIGTVVEELMLSGKDDGQDDPDFQIGSPSPSGIGSS